MTNGVTTATTGGQPPNGNFERRLSAIEAALPTLAIRADLAELRAQNERLIGEMRLQNQQIRHEVEVQFERVRGEMYRMAIGFYKWTIVTTLAISVAIGMFVFGLSNLLTPQVSPVPTGKSSTFTGTKGRASVCCSPQLLERPKPDFSGRPVARARTL